MIENIGKKFKLCLLLEPMMAKQFFKKKSLLAFLAMPFSKNKWQKNREYYFSQGNCSGCTQRQIKLESAACPLSLINDFVTFIEIRKERKVGERRLSQN